MNPFEFIFDDWKKIPQNLRYFFLAGVFLIFNSWLLDHWGLKNPYLFWGIDIRQLGYNIGLSIIIVGFFALLLKQLFYFKNIIWYRWKYPIKNLEYNFFLVWFNGKLYLFDSKTNKRHHIYPFETAQDLLFVGKGKFISKNLEDAELIQVSDALSIDVRKYKEGQPINTRGDSEK